MRLWLRFILACGAGAVAAAGTLFVGLMVPGLGFAAIHGSHGAILIVYIVSLSIGGVVSGSLLWGGLGDRRRKFLYLAAASPASVVWILTIALLVTGTELDRWDVINFFASCLSAWTGSILGYWLAGRLLPLSETPAERQR